MIEADIMAPNRPKAIRNHHADSIMGILLRESY